MEKIKEKDNKKEIEEDKVKKMKDKKINEEAFKCEAIEKMNLEIIKYMIQIRERLREKGLIELNPKSGNHRLTAKCDDAIKNLLLFADLKALIEKFCSKADIKLNYHRQCQFANRAVAVLILFEFDVFQFKNKFAPREMCTVEYLSNFINIHMEWDEQNWKQSNGI